MNRNLYVGSTKLHGVSFFAPTSAVDTIVTHELGSPWASIGGGQGDMSNKCAPPISDVHK